jgi:hypothetical protein
MSYSLSDLEKEIIKTIEAEKLAGNDRIPADWVAHAVMAAHPRITGEDKDFYTVCSYRTVRESTRKVMSDYRKGEAKHDTQMTMEGFEFLQTYYVIAGQKDEDGQSAQVQVHVNSMTFDELTLKAMEHDSFARGHARHRDEIYRFRDAKFAQRASNDDA